MLLSQLRTDLLHRIHPKQFSYGSRIWSRALVWSASDNQIHHSGVKHHVNVGWLERASCGHFHRRELACGFVVAYVGTCDVVDLGIEDGNYFLGAHVQDLEVQIGNLIQLGGSGSQLDLRWEHCRLQQAIDIHPEVLESLRQARPCFLHDLSVHWRVSSLWFAHSIEGHLDVLNYSLEVVSIDHDLIEGLTGVE